jgi:peroxiredoxin
MNENKRLMVGNKAPGFELKDHQGNLFRLSEFKGKKVVLSFHPLAWTSVCAKQMLSLEEHTPEFAQANTVAVGISIDSSPSKKAWAAELGIGKTRLLADFWPHGKVAQEYCIFRDQDGVSERANIVVDEEQTIVFIKIYELSQLPDISEVLRFVHGKEATIDG